MTLGTRGVTAMPLDQLPLRQSCGDRIGKLRDVLGRPRQFLAEQHFANPVAAQDGTGARRTRLLSQSCRKPQDAAAVVLPNSLRAPPVWARNSLNAVELRQAVVDECVVCVQEAQHRA